jgi:hypothetical protein
MWVYDLETLSFLMVNEETIVEFEYTQEKFLSMTIKNIRPPNEIPKLLEILNESRKRNQVYFSG